ncbi:M23 family metallopeptidase [Pelagerythrobacter rhizovicinus]|uniref:M23ase beta-sheet core domain-containing protein n=1 Tax=Pelagerythrobacter rhizovicinus TaxID=2268576 RepID=A0A4Q2KJZ2_9SPHN|nr:M23 family metallopeptidase [Pelagerythrobacter rhizovicinus]RXZ65538.1 hypothetical protein ETX26_01930 [Pelagerythrobacter rhizovicinus]
MFALSLFLVLSPPLWSAATAAVAPAEVRPYQSLHIEVPYTPPVARIEGRDRLVYEVHATNFSGKTLMLDVIEVETVHGDVVARVDAGEAARWVGAPRDPAQRLAPGERAILYLDIPAPQETASLRHRIRFTAVPEDGPAEAVTIVGGVVTPRPPFPLALGAPLRGGPWSAVALPDHANGHRRYPYAVSGRVRLPGRHAIDWMPANGFDPASSGKEVAADGTGADVLAVADGEIVAVKEEPSPGARPSIEDETGAMVVLLLPDGRYAFYQHLAPGIPIRAGDRVVKGQVIARVGASGHVTRPHLHFHVADGPAPLDSEGLPYDLDAGQVLAPAGLPGDAAGSSARLRAIDGLPRPNAAVWFAS